MLIIEVIIIFLKCLIYLCLAHRKLCIIDWVTEKVGWMVIIIYLIGRWQNFKRLKTYRNYGRQETSLFPTEVAKHTMHTYNFKN